MLPLPAAIALAKRWVAFDPMLDIKLLEIGFPSGEIDGETVAEAGCEARPRDRMPNCLRIAICSSPWQSYSAVPTPMCDRKQP